MSGRAIVISLTLGMMGCAAEPLEPAQLGEICGVDGPFRLVALAPDQRLQFWLLPVAGRYVYTILRAPGAGDHEPATEVTLWSIGTCGESPRRLADGIDYTRVDPRWPDLLLGCSFATDETFIVDPAGEQPPLPVFAGFGCSPPRSSSGYVRLTGEDAEDLASPATLSFLPFPDDPRTDTTEPVVLLAPDTHPEYPIAGYSRPAVLEDGLLILTTDGTLLRIDLPSGEVTVEQAGVRGYEVSPDGRYLLYQDRELLGIPGRNEGLVFLRDRTIGDGMVLAQTNLSYSSGALRQYEDGIVTLTLPGNVVRMFLLPSLDFVDLPSDVHLVTPISDGRWLMQKGDEGGPIYLGDPYDRASTTTLFGGGTMVRLLPDAVIVLDAPPCCLTEDAPYAEGGLWRVPFDGSDARRVAERATNGAQFIDDRRLLTAVNKTKDGKLADLLLLDLESGTEHLVDHEVQTYPAGFSGSLADDILRYQVYDGERSGIWLARLPEAE